MRRLSLPRLAAFAAPLLALTGCGRHAGGTRPSASQGSVFRIAMTGSPTGFDPAMVPDPATIDLLQQMFEGLVRWTPENTLAPALAEKWDVSADGRTYTFHLRPGVHFQDGQPVTAQDVYYSLRRALSHDLGSAVSLTYLGDIVGAREEYAGKTNELSGVKVVDPQTVAITIRKPSAYWIYALTYPTAYVVSKQEADQAKGPLTADLVMQGAGTGGFRLTGYVKDSKVTLAANPSYWAGAPKVAGQERPIVVDAGTRHNLYVSGQLDLVDESNDALQADQADPRLKDQIHYWPRAGTYYVGLNQKFAPFKDVRVRQALACAIDKEKIRQVVFHGQRDAAEDILSKGIPGWDANFKGLPADAARAQSLLASAGYPGGKGFPAITLSYEEGHPDNEKVVQLIRQMWQETLGVSVTLQRTELGTFLNLEHKNALDCYFNSWTADYLDPQDYYSVLMTTQGTQNHTGYSNPKFDALCDAADVERDAVKRAALYRQAAVIAAQDVPQIPVFYSKDAELVKPSVSGIDDGLMGHLPYVHLTLK